MSKASEKLHLSPQGLSLAIRRMEDELGCDLFYRKSSGLILTEIGQQFKTEAEAALRHVDNIYSLCSKGLKKEIHIKGCDATSARVVADCAGYPGSLNMALKIVRSGGTVCEIADSSVLSPVNITYISYKDLFITNSSGCDISKALAGMLDGSLKTRPLIDEIVPLERTSYAFDRQASHDAMKVLVDMNA